MLADILSRAKLSEISGRIKAIARILSEINWLYSQTNLIVARYQNHFKFFLKSFSGLIRTELISIDFR